MIRGFRLLCALAAAAVLTAGAALPAVADDSNDTTTTTSSKKDPLQLAKDRFDEARDQAGQLADKISQAQAQQAQLGDQIAAAEAEIPQLHARADALRLAIKDRAVELYVDHDVRLDAVLQTSSVLDGARAAQLTGSVADHDRDLADELRANAQQLETRETQLRTQKADLQRSLDAMAPMNAELQKRLGLASAAYDLVQRALAAPDQRGGDVSTGASRCPVDGFVVFRDDFGEPRGGGTAHPGIDMPAVEGTPVVAVVPGLVVHDVGGDGGNGAWLTGFDGVAYYYAHFSRYEGDGGFVDAGQRIGYVGQTGNATGPHLHFEVHPGGALAPPVDGYPLLLTLCAAETARAFG
jgi:murein DD-endopeptidase MepM/ murein hydrolase activator NlpD